METNSTNGSVVASEAAMMPADTQEAQPKKPRKPRGKAAGTAMSDGSGSPVLVKPDGERVESEDVSINTAAPEQPGLVDPASGEELTPELNKCRKALARYLRARDAAVRAADDKKSRAEDLVKAMQAAGTDQFYHASTAVSITEKGYRLNVKTVSEA